ncbi:MAG: camphor resistance protein CrcB [Gammaproteobacteria bacterium]|jgi:CrcB protein|nr:camphor resistance protein CrcB [Gammaproteobacteria bacterium]
MNVLLIALGGAAGSVLRFWLAELFYAYGSKAFPYGILTVNIIGCFFIGFFSIFLVSKFGANHALWRAAIMVGVLGGFTTFSGFSLDVVNFFLEGMVLKALSYIALSLIVCLLATYSGIWVGRVIA